MIRSSRCPDTRELFETGKSRKFAGIRKVATRKLAMLDAAETLEFLRSPPGKSAYDLRVAEIENSRRIDREVHPAVA